MSKKSTQLSIIIFTISVIVPLVAGIGYALLYSLGAIGLLSTGWTTAHWTAVLGQPSFWKSLLFSAWCSAWTMTISITTALFIATRGRKRLMSGWPSYWVYLPLTLAAMVVGLLMFQWLSKGGLLSRIAFQIGITHSLEAFPNWINDPWGIGIIAAHSMMAIPFLSLLFLQLFHNERLDEFGHLAATIGANRRQIFTKVWIPILLAKAKPVLILYAIFVMSAYEVPLLLGSQSPMMVSVFTLQKLQKFDLNDIPQAYVISVCYMVLVTCLLIWLQPKPKNDAIHE